MRQSLKQYCEENNRPDLLQQWDKELNYPLTPETVTCGSSRNIWWKCESGHFWQSTPYSRTASHKGCPICARKRIIAGYNDLKTLCPDVAAEWNYSRNGSLKPDNVSQNSHRKVWWKCSLCGYEWLAVIKSRAGIGKSGCPCCSGKIVVPGTNDLATKYPQLATEWHSEKNGLLQPCNVTHGSVKKVWWHCSLGHEWLAAINSRTRGAGCPVCSGRAVLQGVNDLSSVKPEIAAEWDYAKNSGLSPDGVTAFSNKKVSWICPNGHEYTAVIASRSSGSGCPYCTNRKVLTGFNDLASVFPDIAKEWHPTKNKSNQNEVFFGSHAKAWWICPQGHEYESSILSRTSQHTGCPVCANRVIIPEENSLAAQFPQIAAEWNYERNGKLSPDEVASGSNRRVWWRCRLGHEWQTAISSRTSKNTGCPVCLNRKVLPGFNDLATTHPEIAAQWHPALNGSKTPLMFTYGSQKSVWWICAKGHTWKSPISRRTGIQKSGCPICSGRLNPANRRYIKSILDAPFDEYELSSEPSD